MSWTTRGLNPKAATYTAADVTDDLGSKEVWVLEQRGRIVGTATLREWSGGAWRYLYLTHVATPTSLHGRGLGSEVMRRVEAEAATRGVPELHLDTAVEMTELVDFYEKRGYVTFGEVFKWDPSNTYESQKYRKSLGAMPVASVRWSTS